VNVDGDSVLSFDLCNRLRTLAGIVANGYEVGQPSVVGYERSAAFEDPIKKIIDEIWIELLDLGLRSENDLAVSNALRSLNDAISVTLFAMVLF
jgi:hypothetical protein